MININTQEIIESLNENNHSHDGCGYYSSVPYAYVSGVGRKIIPGVGYTWTDANAYANPKSGEVLPNEVETRDYLVSAEIGHVIHKNDYYGSNWCGSCTYTKTGDDCWSVDYEDGDID